MVRSRLVVHGGGDDDLVANGDAPFEDAASDELTAAESNSNLNEAG